MKLNNQSIILCSASPNRLKLLTQLGWLVEVEPSYIEEVIDLSMSAGDIVMSLAKQKMAQKRLPDKLYISADTLVFFNGKPLGKPSSKEDAMAMLTSICGTSHDVYTGVCMAFNDQEVIFYERTKVWFHDDLDELIMDYVESGLCFNKAGSYGIQDVGALFVKRIDGDFYNIVGLPIAKIYQQMKLFL